MEQHFRCDEGPLEIVADDIDDVLVIQRTAVPAPVLADLRPDSGVFGTQHFALQRVLGDVLDRQVAWHGCCNFVQHIKLHPVCCRGHASLTQQRLHQLDGFLA